MRTPGTTGIESYEKLVNAGHAIPTILIAAYPDQTFVIEPSEPGSCAYQPKPVTSEARLRPMRPWRRVDAGRIAAQSGVAIEGEPTTPPFGANAPHVRRPRSISVAPGGRELVDFSDQRRGNTAAVLRHLGCVSTAQQHALALMTSAGEGLMTHGISSALDDCVSRHDSSVAARAATMFNAGGSRVGAAAPDRPRWDPLSAPERIEKLERRKVSLRTIGDEPFRVDAIIGRSPNLIAAIDSARKVAATATTVLLTGESGTGKEVLARAIHQGSARAGSPFVALNCAALPETLVESELFGHERGAFTGADRLKRGRFELAAGGTLFLDEIGELTPAVQATLLRVLQEKEYVRVGGTVTLDADVRLIVATNRELERAVANGRFREDLYYRVAVFRIHLPTLRERGEDVLLLAEHFLRELSTKMGRREPRVSGEARELLLAHSWPGNVRELQNTIERALILAEGPLISAQHLGIASPSPRDATTATLAAPPKDDAATTLTIAAQEKRAIVEALERTHGHQGRAARLLGLTRFQLYGRLKRYNIEVGRGSMRNKVGLPSDS